MFALNKAKTRFNLISFFLVAVCSASSYAQIPTDTPALVTPTATPLTSVSTPTAAQPAMFVSSPMSASTAAEIQKINEHMTVLQAQLNELELKAKIAAKQREISASAGGDNTGVVTSSFASKNGNPSVISVAGLKGQVEAVLVFPGGVTQRVKTGDVIDDRRVTKISTNEVILTNLKGKNVQRLAFGSTAIVRETTQPQQGLGMPSLPPGMPR